MNELFISNSILKLNDLLMFRNIILNKNYKIDFDEYNENYKIPKFSIL